MSENKTFTKIVTIKMIDPDCEPIGAQKPGAYTEIMWQDDRGISSKRVHKKAPHHDFVLRLKPKDQAQITMEKQGEYWNIVDVCEPHTTSPNKVPNQAALAPHPSGNSGGNQQDEFRRSKHEMRRNEALHAAIALVGATMGGMDNPEVAASRAISIAPFFIPYLESGESLALKADVPNVLDDGLSAVTVNPDDDNALDEDPFK